MALMDEVLLYHAHCAEIGVVGHLKVARSPSPNPLQFDARSPYFDPASSQTLPRWTAVDLTLFGAFPQVIPLTVLKMTAAFIGSALIQKASDSQYCRLPGRNGALI